MLKGFYKHGFDCVGGLPAQPKKGVMAELRRKLNRGPGADGAAVALAGKRERRRAKAAFANWGFNLVASHKVSLHRAVPDHRDPACAKRDFAAEVGVNVSASVVVVFHNEAWQAASTKLCTTVINEKINLDRSTLLRTVWSVLHTSPGQFLHEVVLVDDASNRPHLRKKLDKYIRKHLPSKVRLRRLRQRQGLIRARSVGARLATGTALVFLDSHEECADGWLEPLLAELAADPKAVVAPHLDVVDHNTLEYVRMDRLATGGFGWDARFRVPQAF